ncbi:MAG: NAD-dependent deacylase [Halieaceae bacterium]
MPYFNDRYIDQIVILTGAGVSAESGLATFRDSDGLWEQHDPMEIATPEAFARNPDLVYRFYNARREQLSEVQPNAAHRAVSKLQREFPGEVFLVTQNVDDLHERGGSTQVCHMHGTLQSMLCTSCGGSAAITSRLDSNSLCELCGSRGSVRPDIVWFGEMPYFMEEIDARIASCGLFIAMGTSGTVYPAAGFVRHARDAGALCLELNKEAGQSASLFDECRPGLATDLAEGLVAQLLTS